MANSTDNDPASPKIKQEERKLLNRPGWDLPLDHNHLNGCAQSLETYGPLTTEREIAMLGIVNAITDKQDWQRKVFDENIVRRWRAEAVTASNRMLPGENFDWCILEVRDKAKRYMETNFVNIFDTRYTVAKSDSIVPEALRQELQAACQHFLEQPDSNKDYHPGSDGQVLNLVHPSLFPLVYGRSRVLDIGTVPLRECSTKIGKGQVIPAHPDFPWDSEYLKPTIDYWSPNYQWLPSELKFGDESKVIITSYINNLHPVGNEAVYAALEQFVDAAIPMWNECLPMKFEQRWKDREGALRIPCDGRGLYDPADPIAGEDDDQWKRTRRIVHPIPVPYESWHRTKTSDFDLRTLCKDDGLQIIFKLASIELTPEKPRYAGGSWHVEGQFNEHIAATALYYYDCENITEARLHFQQEWSLEETIELQYRQDDHDGVNAAFGWTGNSWDDTTVQELGSAMTKQGRMLVFPNNYRHRVAPFELAYHSQPGHRRFLVMWLVDPWNRILSIANVPPQQRDWWVAELQRIGSLPLPPELASMVGDRVNDFPISLKDAKEIRLGLMEERTTFDTDWKSNIEGVSLCEH